MDLGAEESRGMVDGWPKEGASRTRTLTSTARAEPVALAPDVFPPTRPEAEPPDTTLYQRWFKRAFDVVVSGFLLFIGLPLVVLVAIAVRTGLGRGVFYTQHRVGRDGRTFTIVKFRTMRHDRRQAAVEVQVERRQSHKHLDDPRHTALGRFLRRLSLDELPQLWNVFKGDMSLVGPRPEIYAIAAERGYLEHIRHTVRPGMTGPYQISDLRFDGDLRDGLDLDVDYVRNLTFRNDLRYLIATPTVFMPTKGGS